MNLSEMMEPGGTGIIATASKAGAVNTAIYAYPHLVDGETVAWGMTDGRTWDNIRENPNASFAYISPGKGFRGARLSLVLSRTVDSGELLEEIRERVRTTVSGNPAAVKHVAYFRVAEARPLV